MFNDESIILRLQSYGCTANILNVSIPITEIENYFRNQALCEARKDIIKKCNNKGLKMCEHDIDLIMYHCYEPTKCFKILKKLETPTSYQFQAILRPRKKVFRFKFKQFGGIIECVPE